jgi:hypothetical protein
MLHTVYQWPLFITMFLMFVCLQGTLLDAKHPDNKLVSGVAERLIAVLAQGHGGGEGGGAAGEETGRGGLAASHIVHLTDTLAAHMAEGRARGGEAGRPQGVMGGGAHTVLAQGHGGGGGWWGWWRGGEGGAGEEGAPLQLRSWCSRAPGVL